LKLSDAHKQTLKIIKWVVIPLGVLLSIIFLLLISGVIKADLSWDDGTRLSPVLALFLLGTGILVSVYSVVFTCVAVIKLIFPSNKKIEES
jgi:hypothetical protein